MSESTTGAGEPPSSPTPAGPEADASQDRATTDAASAPATAVAPDAEAEADAGADTDAMPQQPSNTSAEKADASMQAAADPAGWREVWNEKRQRPFYHHKTTKQTTWRKPEGFVPRKKKRRHSGSKGGEEKETRAAHKRARKASDGGRADNKDKDRGQQKRRKDAKGRKKEVGVPLDAKGFQAKVRPLISKQAKQFAADGLFGTDEEMNMVVRDIWKKVERTEADQVKQAKKPTMWKEDKKEKLERYILNLMQRRVYGKAKSNDAAAISATVVEATRDDAAASESWMMKRQRLASWNVQAHMRNEGQ
eukprot:g2643.t1